MLSYFQSDGRPSETIHEITRSVRVQFVLFRGSFLFKGRKCGLGNPGIADKTLCFCYCFSYERTAAARSFHRKGVETDSALAHASAGATLADPNALQLGTSGRHNAVFSRSGETKRSALSGSGGRSRRHSGTA